MFRSVFFNTFALRITKILSPISMDKYRIKISGVHYGANGDSVAGQKDTEEMHMRTREMLSWIDRERPMVVLGADPANHIHQEAIMARARGRRIGRVALECVDLAWALLRQSGRQMVVASVSEVAVREHGYVVVTVSGDDVRQPCQQAAPEIEWKPWLSDLPLLPPSEQLLAEDEAAFLLDNYLLPKQAETGVDELKAYLNIWMEGSRHDLSREARQKRSAYIECFEAAADKEVRLLAEPLKEQRRRMCEREPLDELTTTWWQQRMQDADVQRLWQQWQRKNDKKLWLGLRRIDTLLRQLPGELYGDIGQLDVVLSRLYYMNTPLKAFQAIMALLMLRQLTCSELGIEMRPMTEADYGLDGRIADPMMIPTTIARVVAFGETQCDRTQRQTIQQLVYWLRDDYEQEHQQEIESLVEDTQTQLTAAIKQAVTRPTTQTIYGDKNEFAADSKLIKMALPADADPAEIAMRIAEQQQKQIGKKDNHGNG